MDFMQGSLGANAVNPYDYEPKSASGVIPIRVQIEREKSIHTQELKRLDAMLKLIEENPAIEQFINLQRGYTE
jgi:hypothetical protein